jgi:hypothetical protein
MWIRLSLVHMGRLVKEDPESAHWFRFDGHDTLYRWTLDIDGEPVAPDDPRATWLDGTPDSNGRIVHPLNQS